MKYGIRTITWGLQQEITAPTEWIEDFQSACAEARELNQDFSGTLMTAEVISESGEVWAGAEL